MITMHWGNNNAFYYICFVKFNISFSIDPRPILDRFGKVVLLGSCFAEHQAESFRRAGFDVLSNPFGVLYDPLSWARILQRCANDKLYSPANFETGEHGLFSFEMHGSMTFDSTQTAIDTCNQQLKELKDYISKSELIVLTFGTSLVFEHIDKNIKVANCHKLPNSHFHRIQMTMEQCVESFEVISDSIRKINPHCQLISTISPVRHIRSGIPENFLSKSNLRVALDRSALADSYFPAFEIFIDELRDHRFSKEDLVHPNAQAQAYIWKRFLETICTPIMHASIKEVEKFRTFEAHRPLRKPENHTELVDKKRSELRRKFPDIQI